MKTRILLFVVLAFLSGKYANAQVYNDLDERTNKKIAERAREEVGQFTDYLKEIADKKIERKTRLYYKDIALKLFVGEGKEWVEEILNSEGTRVVDRVNRKAVTMGVTSLGNPKPRKKPMADYLLGLAEIRYNAVTIETTDWHDMRVSEVRKVGDDKYECTVYFEQVFTSKGSDNIPGYSDRTKKKVTCYIDLVQTDDGLEILVQLGDVTAYETKKL